MGGRGSGGHKVENATVATTQTTAATATARAETAILHAYSKLTGSPGTSVSLARVRDALPSSLARTDVDKALLSLDRARKIQLDPDPNRKALSDRAKAAAIHLGGEDMHLISVG
jgi:hypothetical protein